MTQSEDADFELSAMEYLLNGKPTAFQRDLLLLARRANWDENDPGFAVPLILGQIERVLEHYPERIKAAMEGVSRASEMHWGRIQAALKITATNGVQAAERMDNRLQRVSDLLALERVEVERLLAEERRALCQVMAEERDALRQLMADEREALRRLMTQEHEAMVRRAQALTEQQKQVLETQTRNLLAEGVTRWKEQVVEQVDRLIKQVREKQFWETISMTLLVALSIAVIGWTAGWFLGNQQRAVAWDSWQQQVTRQRAEIGWLLEKANRAECFYGIKPRGNAQCRQYQ